MMQATKHFTPHFWYKLVALFCGGLMALFGWNLAQRFTFEAAFFVVMLIGVVAWCGYSTLSQVAVTSTAVTLQTPLRANRQVEFRQLISVSENGRFNPVITLLYHPHLANGLLDLDEVHSLILPALRDQEQVVTLLAAKVRT